MPLIEKGSDVAHAIAEAAGSGGVEIRDGDVVAVSDKILSASEGRVVNYSRVRPSQRADELAERYGLEPGFVELVLGEADEVYGGAPRALLTLKHGVLVANAGMDHKNAPPDHASLWPRDPDASAAALRGELQGLTGRRIGVLLVDSHVAPMRMGTVGLAIGVAGLNPVRDCRGVRDLYGKPLLITRINLADDLASAAHLAMGEADERTAVVVIRGAPVEITDRYDPDAVRIPLELDLYAVAFGMSRRRGARGGIPESVGRPTA